MPSNSVKYICPHCYQIARSTASKPFLVCGYCDMAMVKARMAPASRKPASAPEEPALDDLNRGLDS